MTERKVYELVGRLLEKTRRGELAWEVTPSREAFLTVLGAFAVKIFFVLDKSGKDATLALSVSDSEGRAIETSRDVDLANRLGPTVPVMQTMRDLYAEARRSALGVDAALDQILSELR